MVFYLAMTETRYGFVYYKGRDVFEVLQTINDIIFERGSRFQISKPIKNKDGTYLINIKYHIDSWGSIFIEISKIENGVFEIELYSQINKSFDFSDTRETFNSAARYIIEKLKNN